MSIVSTASAFFNGERLLVAGLGALLIMYGSDATSDASYTPEQRQMAMLAYSAGWIILALSTVYLHTKHPRGIAEPLSGRSLLALASALAIITGSSMAGAEGSNASQKSRMLFVGGWMGLALAISARSLSPFRLSSDLKIFLGVSAVVVGLMGVHAKRPFDVDSSDGKFLGLIPVDEDSAWPHGLHYAGLALFALAIAYHA